MFFFSSRRRHTRCALVTGVQTCALPIWRDRVGGEAARHFLNCRLIVGQPELHDVSQDKAGVKPSPNPCPFSPIFAVYQIFCITEPKSSSSEGSSFGFANGLETQVSLIRSRKVMLLLVLLPPQEPQPSEKFWRMPFHRLPLFDGACGWFTITRDVLVA